MVAEYALHCDDRRIKFSPSKFVQSLYTNTSIRKEHRPPCHQLIVSIQTFRPPSRTSSNAPAPLRHLQHIRPPTPAQELLSRGVRLSGHCLTLSAFMDTQQSVRLHVLQQAIGHCRPGDRAIDQMERGMCACLEW